MRNSLNKSKPTKKLRGKMLKQKPTPRSTKAATKSSTDYSSASDTLSDALSEIDFFSRPGAMVSNRGGSSLPSPSFEYTLRRSNVNDSIGQSGSSSKIRRNTSGIKAGSKAGPLSRIRPQATSSPRRSNARTSKSPAKKAPRKQAKPKKRGDHVLREIRLLQNSVYYLIPLAPFHRIVREIMQQENTFGPHEDWRITADALKALQSAAETYIINLMEDASFCTYHRNRITLSNKDMVLVRMLRRELDIGSRN